MMIDIIIFIFFCMVCLVTAFFFIALGISGNDKSVASIGIGLIVLFLAVQSNWLLEPQYEEYCSPIIVKDNEQIVLYKTEYIINLNENFGRYFTKEYVRLRKLTSIGFVKFLDSPYYWRFVEEYNGSDD